MLIEAVYEKWNADKFDDVPRLMEKYLTQEAEIYDHIVRKYVFCRPQKDWQPLIEAMYARFNPSKLQELDGILAKYKESEAALYRALCDKYLPTLIKEDQPLVFKVWDNDVFAGSALSVKDIEEDIEEVVRLVSPSQEREQSNSDAATPSRKNLDTAAQLGAEVGQPKKEKMEKEKNKGQKKASTRAKNTEAFPPPLPRQGGRENMPGVNDLPNVNANADPSQTTTGLEKSEKKSRRTDASLRPKAAARPPDISGHLNSAGLAAEVVATPSGSMTKRKRQKHHKENGLAEDPIDGVDGLERRRKKRRKVLSNTACDQDGSNFEAPHLHMLDGQLLTDSNLEQRRQQLKEKLLELKTQISAQVPSNAAAMQSDSLHISGQASLSACDNASSYSYSEDEQGRLAGAGTEAEQAENRTVVLRNKLEAQLRQKLVNSLSKH